MLDDVSAAAAFGSAQFDVSRDGTAVYRYGRTPGRTLLKWLDADGRTDLIRDEGTFYRFQFPRVSPDGKRVVVTVSDGTTQDLWIYDWQRGSRQKVTNGGINNYPLWTPDGQYIVFVVAGQPHWTRADGAEPPQPLMPDHPQQRFTSLFSPDGKRLLVWELNPGGGTVIQVVPIEASSGKLRADSRRSSAGPDPATLRRHSRLTAGG